MDHRRSRSHQQSIISATKNSDEDTKLEKLKLANNDIDFALKQYSEKMDSSRDRA